TGPSSPADEPSVPASNIGSPPTPSGTSSSATSSGAKSSSASAAAPMARPASTNTPASAARCCASIPSKLAGSPRSSKTSTLGSPKRTNGAGSARSMDSKPATPPPSKNLKRCVVARGQGPRQSTSTHLAASEQRQHDDATGYFGPRATDGSVLLLSPGWGRKELGHTCLHDGTE